MRYSFEIDEEKLVEGQRNDETKVETKEAFSRHDHPHPGLSIQMRLLLELGGGLTHNEHRNS
jgi:hypothetical protein